MNYTQELNRLDRKYLIDCIEKHGYILNPEAPVTTERAIETEIDPSLVCTFLMEKKYTELQRKQLQSIVHAEMTKLLGPNFTKIKDSDIDYIFKRIDYLFCGNSLKNMDTKPVAKLFKENEKVKKGVLGIYNYNENIIKINSELLLKALAEGSHEICNGVICKSRVAVLQSVVEHEIVHMIVMNSCYERTSHGRNFMAIAKKIFGHIKFTHSIGLQPSIVDDRLLAKHDFKEFQKVSFIDKKRNVITGMIIKLNPVNAIVRTDNDIQYNVPYYLLTKIR